MKKIIAVMLAAVLALCACALAEGSYKVGICNYVDDASLNQIVENIQNRLADIAAEKGVSIDIDYQNCNADASVMQQIISNFIADGVDLMVGVATPVAMTMQSMTEDNQIPVVFAAVTDPVAAELVASLDARLPGYRRGDEPDLRCQCRCQDRRPAVRRGPGFLRHPHRGRQGVPG